MTESIITVTLNDLKLCLFQCGILFGSAAVFCVLL